MRHPHVPVAASLALLVLGVTACAPVKTETGAADTITFACKRGLDADCDAQAYAACPNGYENATDATEGARSQTRVIRCK